MPEDPLYLPDAEDRVSVDIVSGLSNGEEAPHECIATARLLGNLPSFQDRLIAARDALELTEPVVYTEHPSLEDMQRFHEGLSPEQLDELASRGYRIRERFRLSENWRTSMEVAIITNHLPVPVDPRIKLHTPAVAQAPTLSNVLADLYDSGVPLQSPAIYPLYRVTLRQLKAFIDEHSTEIQEAMSHLPEPPRATIDSRTWLRGRMAWYLKTENESWTWAHVADWMNNILGDYPEFGIIDEVEARNSYLRFRAQLARIDGQ